MRRYKADEVQLTPVRLAILSKMADHLDVGGANDLRSLAQAAGIHPMNMMLYHIDRLHGGGYAKWAGGQIAITRKGRHALEEAKTAAPA